MKIKRSQGSLLGRLETDSRAISAPKLGRDSGLINNPHTNMEMKSKIND